MKTTSKLLGSVLLAPLVTTLSLAPQAHADTTGPTRLLCNQSGVAVLDVQYDGPRYADSFSLHSFDGDLVKKLVSASEQTLRFTGSQIGASITMGSCSATPGRDTILTCDATVTSSGGGWVIARYDFQHFRAVGRSGFSENVSVERDLRIDSLHLAVSKKRVYDSVLRRYYTAAQLKLTLSGESPFASFSLVEERLLGELVAESELTPWGRCAFVK